MHSADSNLSDMVLVWKIKSGFPFFENTGLHPKLSDGHCLQSLLIGEGLSFV